MSSLDEYKDIFIVPWQEIIKNFIFFFLLGIFCLKSNSNEREYGILTLYFYILITIIFDNPFSVSALFIAGNLSIFSLLCPGIWNLHNLLYHHTESYTNYLQLQEHKHEFPFLGHQLNNNHWKVHFSHSIHLTKHMHR